MMLDLQISKTKLHLFLIRYSKGAILVQKSL